MQTLGFNPTEWSDWKAAGTSLKEGASSLTNYYVVDPLKAAGTSIKSVGSLLGDVATGDWRGVVRQGSRLYDQANRMAPAAMLLVGTGVLPIGNLVPALTGIGVPANAAQAFATAVSVGTDLNVAYNTYIAAYDNGQAAGSNPMLGTTEGVLTNAALPFGMSYSTILADFRAWEKRNPRGTVWEYASKFAQARAEGYATVSARSLAYAQKSNASLAQYESQKASYGVEVESAVRQANSARAAMTAQMESSRLSQLASASGTRGVAAQTAASSSGTKITLALIAAAVAAKLAFLS